MDESEQPTSPVHKFVDRNGLEIELEDDEVYEVTSTDVKKVDDVITFYHAVDRLSQ